MKVLFTFILAVVCVVVLYFGHSYWKQRTDVKAEIKPASVQAVTPEPAPKKAQSNIDMLYAKTKNWPAASREQFQQALKQNKPFKILFVGSKALGTKDQGMMKDTIQQLTDNYGSNHLEIAIDTYDTTTNEFLADKDQYEIEAEKAQLIVLEPFLLNDNGKVMIGDSLNNITKIMDEIKVTNPDTTFILMPSFPLYDAKYYLNQVAGLKQYAAQHQIPYLDHWAAWPDTKNVQLKDYLLPDLSGPNEKGDQVWSQYLMQYFISN